MEAPPSPTCYKARWKSTVIYWTLKLQTWKETTPAKLEFLFSVFELFLCLFLSFFFFTDLLRFGEFSFILFFIVVALSTFSYTFSFFHSLYLSPFPFIFVVFFPLINPINILLILHRILCLTSFLISCH